MLSTLLAGCLESSDTAPVQDDNETDVAVNYQLPSNYVAPGETANALIDAGLISEVQSHYGWSCNHGIRDDDKSPSFLSFDEFGNGTAETISGGVQNLTWELDTIATDTSLMMQFDGFNVEFSEFTMGSPIEFSAYNYRDDVSGAQNMRLSPQPEPTVECAAVDVNLNRLEFTRDMFANGRTQDTLDSTWYCDRPNAPKVKEISLSMDGLGTIVLSDLPIIEIAYWEYRFPDLLAITNDGSQLLFRNPGFSSNGRISTSFYIDSELHSSLYCITRSLASLKRSGI